MRKNLIPYYLIELQFLYVYYMLNSYKIIIQFFKNGILYIFTYFSYIYIYVFYKKLQNLENLIHFFFLNRNYLTLIISYRDEDIDVRIKNTAKNREERSLSVTNPVCVDNFLLTLFPVQPTEPLQN